MWKLNIKMNSKIRFILEKTPYLIPKPDVVFSKFRMSLHCIAIIFYKTKFKKRIWFEYFCIFLCHSSPDVPVFCALVSTRVKEKCKECDQESKMSLCFYQVNEFMNHLLKKKHTILPSISVNSSFPRKREMKMNQIWYSQ